MDFEKISVFVVESDVDSLSLIMQTLESNSMVSAVDSAPDSNQALLKLISFKPDLILLEYPAPGANSKELITFIRSHLEDTLLVFVSETKEHALAAIRLGVYNYLLKPVSPEELKSIAEKVIQIKNSNQKNRINQLIQQVQADNRLRLQTTRGFILLDPNEILYCKADGFFTEVNLTDNRKELSYLFISKLDEILKEYNFMRVSRSFLINLKYIRKIHKSTNTIVLTCNGKEYSVKSSKQHIRNLSKTIPE